MKRKGFTLIELLAVIVILAIVALIAVSMIMGVIENVRKESLKATGRAIYEAGQNYHMNNEVEGQVVICSIFQFGKNRTETEIIDGMTYEPISKLSLKGEMPKGGYIKVCNGKIEVAIDNGEYTYVKTEEKEDILNGQVEEIDSEEPKVSASVSGKIATFTISDNIGVIGYGVNQSTETAPTYTSIESTTSSELTWTATEAGEYVVWVKDESGKTATATFTVASTAFTTAVTYVINGSIYTENVPNGATVLSPTTFTTVVNGYTFKGWSESASSTTILTSKTASGTPLTLYAVMESASVIYSTTTSNFDNGGNYYSFNTLVNYTPDWTKYSSAIATVTLNYRSGDCGANWVRLLYNGTEIVHYANEDDSSWKTATFTHTQTSGTFLYTGNRGNGCAGANMSISISAIGKLVVG